MLLAQRPRELMLVGDEHRNQYFQVNIQVLTFFQFYFPMRSRNSIWPEINPCWCGWRWWGAQLSIDVFGAQLSVTKCLKFDLLVWNQILCCSQAEAVGLRLTLSTLGRPSSCLICHHHFITNQSLMHTHGSKCVFCTRLKLAGICHHHFISSTSSVHTLSSLQRFCRSAN